MRMRPLRWRLPVARRAVLCLAFYALILGAVPAGGESGATATCRGVICAIDREGRTLKIEKSPGAHDLFRLDAAVSLIFRGVRTLRIDDLRPGMRVEIDYRPQGGENFPTVTWIEVLEDKGK